MLSPVQRQSPCSPAQERQGGGPAPSGPLQTQIRDRLELSQSALSLARQMAQPKEKSIWEQMNDRREQAEAQGKRLAQEAKVRKLCAKIAARIRNGDRVPMKDMRYLLQKDPNLYLMATLMRKENDDPKKWESLIKDGEERQDSAPGEAAEGASVPSAAEAPAVE